MRLFVAFVRYMICWLWTLFMAFLASIGMLFAPIWSWTFFARPWARGAMGLIGARIHIDGAHNLEHVAVYICNHESQVDVAIFPGLLPRTSRLVAKKEIKKIPLWGWAFAQAGAVLIDRSDPRGAVAAIRDGVAELPEGWSVGVFPEGTRSRDGSLQRFKKGAFHIAMQTGLPMVPIGIAGAREIIPKGGWVARGGRIDITVGDPVPTDDWTIETMNEHVAEMRRRVEQCIHASRQRQREALGAVDSEPREVGA